MKLLAISDVYIPAPFMRDGLAPLKQLGVEVEVRPWEHASLVELQEANLAIENGGPEAVQLPESLLEGCDEFDAVVVQFAPVGQALIERATRLKVIGVLRGGTENIAVDTASQRGICVMNTPGRNARAVAECTIALMLSEVRNVGRSHAALKQGAWRRDFPNRDAIPELHGKFVGLVGYGAVGRLVAHYLFAFGSQVLAYDPYYQGDSDGVEFVELPTLLKRADIISLHARLTDDSHHLIGPEQFDQMKTTAVLVNTARSGLVDEAALVAALQSNSIMGAAIDVFDQEPLDANHPLVALDNVTITPHLAGSTIDAFRNSPAMMAEHLARLLSGQPDLPITNGVQPDLPGTSTAPS